MAKKTLVVADSPEFGMKSNQLFATYNEEDTIRSSFYGRFMKQAYGTVNVTTKHAYCGAPLGIGYSLGLSPDVSAGLCDVDWDNYDFAFFIGTAPGASGLSLNRMGAGLSESRVNRKAKYVCLDPILRSTVANNTNARWQPILPGTDTAFIYGMIQVMLEEGWINKSFLANPNEAAAKKAGEINWSNATYLINEDTGMLADATDFGLGQKGENLVCVNGKLANATTARAADLFVCEKFKTVSGRRVKLCSSLELLKKTADSVRLGKLANICGVEKEDIRRIAEEFTHNGRRVIASFNTGSFSTDAVMTAWLVCILNTLVGSHDVKGGAVYNNWTMYGFEGAYDLGTVKDGIDVSAQMTVCCNGNYEDSSEYKRRKARGENPYPASRVYRNLNSAYVGTNAAEMLTALANGDPYRAKALINWRSNAVYTAATIDHRIEKVLADPSRLPLFVGIDAFINETNRFADYIIPDTVMYEEYACDRTWGNFDQCVVAGVPVVESRTVKNRRGRHVCMEEFLLDCAAAMSLPGFGKGAIPSANGDAVDLMSYDDWAVRYMANVALQCKKLPKVTAEDRVFAGLDRAMRFVTPRLTKTEAQQVEALLSRGGYADRVERYNGEWISNGGGKFLQIFNPTMPTLRHSQTGEAFPGIPVLREPCFINGDKWSEHWDLRKFPLRFASYKPTLRSNYSVAYDHCVEVAPENFVYLNKETAQELNVKTGDKVRIEAPSGKPVVGVVRVDGGVAPGAVCVAHAYGHTAYGAEEREVDGVKLPGIAKRAGGVAVNQMMPHDPTRRGTYSMMNDFWAAGNCRTGFPVRLTKV